MCPGGASAQGKDGVLHRKGFVGANAKLAAGIGHALRTVSECEIVGAGENGFGVGRQIEGRELPRGVGRDADAADPWRDKPIATLEAARERIGVELGMQAIEACDRHHAIRGDVLPAIRQRATKVGRSNCVLDERAGLKEIGSAGAGAGHAEIGTAARERKAGDGRWREAIVGAHGPAEHAAGRAIRSQRRIAVGGLRPAKTRRPYAPALLERRWRRRLGEHGVSVALAL